MLPHVSIITVNYRNAAMTCDMLDSLRVISYPNVEVIVVDNGMEEEQGDLFRAHYPGLIYLPSEKNLGFAGGNNLGIAKAKGAYVLLLNNDTLVPSDFLEPMVAAMEKQESIGLLSPKIYYHNQDRILQYAGVGKVHPFTGRNRNRAKLQRDEGQFEESGVTAYAHGACMLIRRLVIEQIGGLSEAYFMYYEELDYCARAAARGWKSYYVANSHIFHRESASMGVGNPLKTYYLFRNRWLFMRLQQPLLSYYCFVVYYLLLGVPKNVFQFLLKKKPAHARAIWQGVQWNLGKGLKFQK